MSPNVEVKRISEKLVDIWNMVATKTLPSALFTIHVMMIDVDTANKRNLRKLSRSN